MEQKGVWLRPTGMMHDMEKLFSIIEEHGWQGRIVPFSRIADIRKRISDLFEQRLIDEVFCREQLSFFSFDPPVDLHDVRSIIIVAVPTPQMRVFFHWQGRRVPVSYHRLY
jgi:hypothetical protein